MSTSESHKPATVAATRELAAWSSALRFEDLPAEVVAEARICMLDTLGCCLFGSTLASVQKLTAMVATENCAAQSAVFGLPMRTSASHAALINASSAHAFQLDEIHIEATLHPGSLAVPVALAIAEAEGGATAAT